MGNLDDAPVLIGGYGRISYPLRHDFRRASDVACALRIYERPVVRLDVESGVWDGNGAIGDCQQPVRAARPEQKRSGITL